MSECAVCEGSGGWARDGGREEVTCEACNGCGSTPDAAPVEVDDGPSNEALAEAIERDADWFDGGGCTATAITYRLIAARLRALPAAPTTPDIADERGVVALLRWLDGVIDIAALAESFRNDPHSRYPCPLSGVEIDAALATPSTPGAGQGDPS